MANVMVVPDKTQLRRYLEKGLTQQQVVDAWERDSGVKVSRSAIAMALARYGLESAHPRDRYEDLLPWKIKPEHMRLMDARNLRLEARRRRGLPLSSRDEKRLINWLDELEQRNAVIVYRPNTHRGFWWVTRNEDDTDIIRVD